MFAGLRWSTPSEPRSCASRSLCLLEIDYGQSRWVHATPIFGRSQTSPRFGCGLLREDAEIRECEPTPRLVNMGGQHRNQTSVARETLSIFHPDICFATEDRRSSLHVGSLWALRCGYSKKDLLYLGTLYIALTCLRLWLAPAREGSCPRTRASRRQASPFPALPLD